MTTPIPRPPAAPLRRRTRIGPLIPGWKDTPDPAPAEAPLLTACPHCDGPARWFWQRDTLEGDGTAYTIDCPGCGPLPDKHATPEDA